MKWILLVLTLIFTVSCGAEPGAEDFSAEAPAETVETASESLTAAPMQFDVYVDGARTAATATICCRKDGRSCGCGPEHPGCCASQCDCGSGSGNSFSLFISTVASP